MLDLELQGLAVWLVGGEDCRESRNAMKMLRPAGGKGVRLDVTGSSQMSCKSSWASCMRLWELALCALCIVIPTIGFGQTPSSINLQRVSPVAMQFIEGGFLLARQALGEKGAIAVSDAIRRGLLSEKCQFGHKDITGLTILFARCPSPDVVIVEVIADSGTLPTGVTYGMSLAEVVAHLGAPSADVAKMAEMQGLSAAWREEGTDLVYLADPESPSTWSAELELEQFKLTRVRWAFGL